MTHAELLDRAWELKLTADMNQRYHQELATRADTVDVRLRIGTSLATVGTLVLGVVSALVSSGWLAGFVGIAAFFAACFSLAVTIGPWSGLHARHAGLMHRWTELEQWADDLRLLVRRGKLDEDKLALTSWVELLRTLESRRHDIDAHEPAPDPKLLERCQHDTWQSFQGEPMTWHRPNSPVAA